MIYIIVGIFAISWYYVLVKSLVVVVFQPLGRLRFSTQDGWLKVCCLSDKSCFDCVTQLLWVQLVILARSQEYDTLCEALWRSIKVFYIYPFAGISLLEPVSDSLRQEQDVFCLVMHILRLEQDALCSVMHRLRLEHDGIC